MKKLMYTALATLIAAVPYTPANAAKFESTSGYKKDRAITGYFPYFEQIGVSLDPADIDGDTGFAVIKVGTKLSVKLNDTTQVRQIDKDYDEQIDNDKYIIVWYALGDGTEDDDYWKGITSWNDIDQSKIEPIKDIDPGAVVQNPSESILYIPAGAAGKRIGFIAVPETKTGRARRGNPVYVWDISKYFKQPDITDPGLPPINPVDPDNPGDVDPTNPNPETPIFPDCPAEVPDCGEIVGPNPEIPTPDPDVPPVIEDGQVMLTMTITDKSTGRSTSGLTTEDNDFDFHVDTPYEAELSFDNGRPFTQEMLDAPGAKVSWIFYRLAENADSATCDATDFADRMDQNCFTRFDLDAIDSSVDANGKLITSYNTQATNLVAAGVLQSVAPDYSEQGYWLEVEFDDGRP